MVKRRCGSLADRFSTKFVPGQPDECWEWLASKDPDGYGMIGAGGSAGTTLKAHRVAYELAIGQVSGGMHVLHHCDNPGCVNPSHLFLGTHNDNMVDKVRKGRASALFGKANGRAKLTEAQIYYARFAGGSQSSIASRIGISQSSVSVIRRGKRWSTITEGV